MHKKLKIIDKKRFALALAALIVFFILIFVITVYAFDISRASDNSYTEYIVSEGDTLWDISVRNKGETDVRTYLYLIKKINNLSTSEISIGMKLKLP